MVENNVTTAPNGSRPSKGAPAQKAGIPQAPSGASRWMITVILAGLVCVVVYAAARAGLFQVPELQGYDILVEVQKPEAPPAEILYVDFDEETVTRYNAFPIPRLLLGDVVKKIASGKPAVIGVDVILDLKRDQLHADADDHQLASIITDAGNVVLVSQYGFSSSKPSEPLPEFASAAAYVAFADLLKDADGSVRRMLLKVVTSKYQRLSFPVAVASYFSDRHLRPKGPGHMLFGDVEIPLITTAPDSALIHFHPSTPVRAVSVQAVLAEGFDPPFFRARS